MKKRMLLLLVLLLVLASMAGCAVYRRPAPNQPTQPGPTTPMVPPNAQAQPSVADEIVRIVNAMQGVKGSYAVVLGNVAMVGVDLKDRLSGEQEDQLKTRIATEVERQIPNLAEVWVSADPDLVVRIRSLADRIARGEPISGFMDEVTELLQKLQPEASRD
jgi:YhcN/YlaJ family sporulation lipoprotein